MASFSQIYFFTYLQGIDITVSVILSLDGILP